MALWHVEHDDGDEEDLDAEECDAAIEAMASKRAYSRDWRTEGHAWLGQRVSRDFGGRSVGGVIVRWRPKAKGGVKAMWHLRHDDVRAHQRKCRPSPPLWPSSLPRLPL